VLVGVNLLREGLDIPEVSLVAILDATRRDFCAPRGRLFRRAARRAKHQRKVIMYADKITKSIQACLDETNAAGLFKRN